MITLNEPTLMPDGRGFDINDTDARVWIRVQMRGNRNISEVEPFANLIHAAPALYEACKAACVALDLMMSGGRLDGSIGDAYIDLTEALAKATGE